MAWFESFIDVAKRVAVAGFGDNARIVKDFKHIPDMITDSAVRSDLRNAAKTVINDAKSYNGIKEADIKKLDKALSDAGKLSGKDRLTAEVNAYNDAISNAVLKDTDDAYKAAINKYYEKDALFKNIPKDGDTYITSGQAEEYFDRKGKGIGVLNMAKGTMYNNELRTGAITAYAGIAVGGRLLNGGSLTTNNRGERDIAGIPFI